MNEKPILLGPFIGHTTATSVKIWVYSEKYSKLFIRIFNNNIESQSYPFDLDGEIPTSCIEIQDLQPDSQYYYKLFTDEKCTEQLLIDDLEDTDLYFWTMPEKENEHYRYDFLVLSCHNPIDAEKNGYKNKGWNVWRTLPQIINETTKGANAAAKDRVLFAILAGDQIYADEVEKANLKKTIDEKQRLQNYLNIYKKFWNNKDYRKVLCSLPTYLMWDDHDITDGWGSREDSFIGDTIEFSENWKNLFTTAKKAFSAMQASRNPKPLSDAGFDVGFKIGRSGFILADLRSNRNVHAKQIWSESQFQAVKNWIECNREQLDVVFFVSPVVFAHGAPKIEKGILKFWPRIHQAFDRIWEIQNKFSKLRKKIINYFVGAAIVVFISIFPLLFSIAIFLLLIIVIVFNQLPLLSYIYAHLIPPFIIDGYYNSIGDLRDDINDSWTADINKEKIEQILNYFFDLQNSPNPLYIVILTGDIHSAGYSNLYSLNPQHQDCPIIHHLVASPVAYPPFPWYGEAVYRHATCGPVKLGVSGSFQAQIAHHYTQRNALVCSLRKYDENTLHLKAKFYIEGFPEPQITIFDLEKSSHKENIGW